MFRSLLITIFGLIVVYSVAFPMTAMMWPAQRGAILHEKYEDRYTKEVFDEADADRDAFVSWEEAKEASRLAEREWFGRKRFNAADVNNDDMLSLEEMQNYQQKETSNARDAKIKVDRRRNGEDPATNVKETVVEKRDRVKTANSLHRKARHLDRLERLHDLQKSLRSSAKQ